MIRFSLSRLRVIEQGIGGFGRLIFAHPGPSLIRGGALEIILPRRHSLQMALSWPQFHMIANGTVCGSWELSLVEVS